MIDLRRTFLKPLMIAGMLLLPGSLLAADDPEQGCCLEFDQPNDRLFAMTNHGQANAALKRLNNVGQAIRGIIDPEVLPAGRCRGVAIRWNVGIILGKDSNPRWQRRIFDKAAQHGCNVTWTGEEDPGGGIETEEIWLATE